MIMKPIFDRKDVDLLRAAQDGIPIVVKPFQNIAIKSGLSEEEVISRLKILMKKGVIRRFAASINIRSLGVIHEMVAWYVPKNRIKEVGKKFARNDRVTHCYARKTVPGRWKYNLFTVIYDYETVALEKLVKDMSSSSGIKDYLVLSSKREFKKTSNGRIVERAISRLVS